MVTPIYLKGKMLSLKKGIETIILESRKEEGLKYKNWDSVRREQHRQQRVIDIVALKEANSSSLFTVLKSYMEEASKFDQHDVDACTLVCKAMGSIGAAEELLQASMNTSFQWYGRVNAINSLNTYCKTSIVRKLLPILDDQFVVGEIHASVITALSLHGVEDVLPRIEKIEKDKEILSSWWDAERHLLAAKARLGVDSILRPLINMSYNDWSHTRKLGADALVKFTEKKEGLEGVLDVLAPFTQGEATENRLKKLLEINESSEIKCWAMDTLVQLKPDDSLDALIASLGSSYWKVAHKACCFLINFHRDISEPLTLLASDTNNTRDIRLWAIASLAIGYNKKSTSYIQDLDRVTVPWQFKCPEVVRNAIIDEYGLAYEPFTDVRYIIESAVAKRKAFDSENFKEQLIEKLTKEGFSINNVLDCGKWHGSGGGTFYVIDTDNGKFFASTIGPFLTAPNLEHSTDDTSVKQDCSVMDRLQNIITSLGGLWLEDELLDHEVPNLNVYFFGDRGPLTVRDLVFYWQD